MLVKVHILMDFIKVLNTLKNTELKKDTLKGIINSIEIMINNSYELSSHNKGVLISALEVLKRDYLV